MIKSLEMTITPKKDFALTLKALFKIDLFLFENFYLSSMMTKYSISKHFFYQIYENSKFS